MTIGEFADMIDAQLVLTRYPNQDGRWSASFSHSETKRDKNDSILAASYGNGESPDEAIVDYINNIKGRLLVLNAYSKGREELVVPKTLTVS